MGEEYPPPQADWPIASRARTSAASSTLVKMFFMFAPFLSTFLPAERKAMRLPLIDRTPHAAPIRVLKRLTAENLRLTQKRINGLDREMKNS
ncbi:MAG: hypothetical protein DMF54_16675 [Acidobacteria bacterium]|nr:MAG: hypothetical protein DMF55_13160 [Acidobacteriota bacterium]PYQ63483.1 MAG: hypothetical protein DMF54_16675 [Acidobacteriota bacterium]